MNCVLIPLHKIHAVATEENESLRPARLNETFFFGGGGLMKWSTGERANFLGSNTPNVPVIYYPVKKTLQ